MQPKSNFSQKDFLRREKNFWKKVFASPACLLATFGLLAGAGCNTPNAPPPKKYQGVVVKVACPPDGPATILEQYGRIWADKTGAQLEVIRQKRGNPAEEAPADVWILRPAELPRWAAASQLLPLSSHSPALESNFAWGNILPIYRQKLLIWDRTPYGLPLLGDAPLCFYREDLFQDKGHQTAFRDKYHRDLGPPATWEELVDIAEFFNRREPGGSSAAHPSLSPLPASAEGLDQEFFAIAAPFARRAIREGDRQLPPEAELFSFHYDLETGTPRIDTPAFVHALKLMQRLQACRAKGFVPQPAELFRQGKAVLCLAGLAWIGRFQEEGSPVRGRFQVCRVPGTKQPFDYRTGKPLALPEVNYVSYLGAGGWLGVVPRSAAQPDAAFALLADLISPKTSSEILVEPSWGGGAFRRDHFQILLEGDPFDLGLQPRSVLVECLRQTIDPPSIPVLRLRTPDEFPHMQTLVEEVRKALLDRNADPAEALKIVAQRWRQIDERKDPQTRQAEYRLSLSLVPKALPVLK